MAVFAKVLLLATTWFVVVESQCSICGDGNQVTAPESVISFPDQPQITCAELEEDGEAGALTSDQCDFLPTLIGRLCECAPILPCNICGEGNEVNDPDAIFAFPGEPTRTCGELKDAGAQGDLDESLCDVLPTLITNLCECEPVGSTTAPAPTPTASPVEGCSVCGEGNEVNDPDAIFAFPGEQTRTCGELEDAGEQGDLDEIFCEILPDIIPNLCGCQPVGSTTAPIPATPPAEACSVCGEGNEVNDPDVIFSFPGEPTRTCGELEDAGEQGDLDEAFCEILPIIIDPLCDCQPVSTSTPTSTPVFVLPTDAPVIPTIAPVTGAPVDPTESPVEPTAAPVSDAPVDPTEAPVEPTYTPVFVLPTDTPVEPTHTPVFVLPTDAPVEPVSTSTPTSTPVFVLPTDAPVMPTVAPVTSAPVDPTESPVEPTAAPVSDAPVDPTGAPVEPTHGPVFVLPTDAPVEPVSTSTPTYTPVFVLPTETPVEPVSTSTPTYTPVYVLPTDAPVITTIAPVSDAPVEPTDAPAEPTEAPVQPTDAPVSPTDAPVEPTEAPVQPTDAPVSPTDAPIQPTDAPVEPTKAPAEPTEAPVQPTDAPVEPTKAPVEPTEAPVQLTDAPVEPTEAPVQPTDAPVEPTEAPVAPTLAPVIPTLPPVEPTISPTISRTHDPTMWPTSFGKKLKSKKRGGLIRTKRQKQKKE